ncbi:four helix bundle protein [Microcoleus sp. LEGE 07076]|uniref:four helix bundle protein n=1 Tax=Microcoleus sp. LEGE 07076 TaxID=915322 RepID=UPI0018816A09|nr:four helix bundle protein [Microcoleus sp. LEGE 07076]
MDEQEFKKRTNELALRVIKLVGSLPKNTVSEVIGKQLIRSGSSVGANYRAACGARSTADLIAKLRIVEEAADECIYWMELIVEAKLVDVTNLRSIMSETNEILAMTVASIKTLMARNPTGNRK